MVMENIVLDRYIFCSIFFKCWYLVLTVFTLFMRNQAS